MSNLIDLEYVQDSIHLVRHQKMRAIKALIDAEKRLYPYRTTPQVDEALDAIYDALDYLDPQPESKEEK